jgi:predicted DNA repair protein MutK
MSYVKPVAYIGGAYVMFEIAKAMWWELKINNHNNRVLQSGGVMSDEDEAEKEVIQGYLDNHYGSQLMNKLSAQNIMEE